MQLLYIIGSVAFPVSSCYGGQCGCLAAFLKIFQPAIASNHKEGESSKYFVIAYCEMYNLCEFFA